MLKIIRNYINPNRLTVWFDSYSKEASNKRAIRDTIGCQRGRLPKVGTPAVAGKFATGGIPAPSGMKAAVVMPATVSTLATSRQISFNSVKTFDISKDKNTTE
jgi:hypothetical protein